ncbi:MAG: hypothetical protein ACLFVO_21860 [Chloroflexaceae bacterium]
MASQVTSVATAHPIRPRGWQMGFWTAILTAVAAAAALGIAVTTAPPRSGPFCMVDLVGECITYPYTDAAAFVPNDYLWMYPAFLLGPLFVILVGCLHPYATADKQVFSHLAPAFALFAAVPLATNYFIQLTVVQASLLRGETAGLSLFSQYNPHGVFIALEDIGYLMLGVAFLFAAAVFDGRDRLERALRLVFVTTGVLAIGALILLALLYGGDLEYRYEVAVIVIDWTALIVAGVLLSRFFRRGVRE